MFLVCMIAIVLRGDRGLERLTDLAIQPVNHQIAIVLRGDRGLEHILRAAVPFGTSQLRSFFGAIEDWNLTDQRRSD